MLFRNKTMLFRCKTMLFLETELSQVYYGLAKVQYRTKKRHSFEELCLFPDFVIVSPKNFRQRV